MQAFVVMFGIGAVLWRALSLSGYDVGAIYHFAASQGHAYGQLADAGFYKVDLHARYNFWALMYIIVVSQLSELSSNQLVVQRLLTPWTRAARA